MTNVVNLTEPADTGAFDVEAIRRDFPALSLEVNGKPLVFLDSAASAQKPRAVIDAMTRAYESQYANVHRGTYHLSQVATENYENARAKVAQFMNAKSPDEIVFTHSATASINLVAHSFGSMLEAGDEIIVSVMEHHANIVPWQLLRDRTGIEIKVAPIDDAGNFLIGEFEKLLGPRTKLVAVTHVSNVLGTVTPVKEIVRLTHDNGTPVLFDGAQGIVHEGVDVQDLDCDFYVWTGHKLYGPTGIGVLWGKSEWLEKMPPFEGGGDMISLVTFEKTTYREPPARFEAGTPPIVEAVGLGAAIDYVTAVGPDRIAAHEKELLDYAMLRLADVEGLRILGRAQQKAGIVSFEFGDVHSHDVATIIDSAGVAVRAGHHCAQPLMERFGVTSTSRASFGMYTTRAEVDALAEALEKVREIFG